MTFYFYLKYFFRSESKFLNSDSEKRERRATRTKLSNEILLIEKRELKIKPERIIPTILKIIIPILKRFSGALIFVKIMKPTTANKMTADVDISDAVNLKAAPAITTPKTAVISVRLAGSAFRITFLIKSFSIRLSFSSKESKNPGIPMVNKLMSESCEACKG